MKNSDLPLKRLAFDLCLFFLQIFVQCLQCVAMYNMQTFKLYSQFTIGIVIGAIFDVHAFVSYPRFTMSIWNCSNSQIRFHSFNSFLFPFSLRLQWCRCFRHQIHATCAGCSRDNYFKSIEVRKILDDTGWIRRIDIVQIHSKGLFTTVTKSMVSNKCGLRKCIKMKTHKKHILYTIFFSFVTNRLHMDYGLDWRLDIPIWNIFRTNR